MDYLKELIVKAITTLLALIHRYPPCMMLGALPFPGLDHMKE